MRLSTTTLFALLGFGVLAAAVSAGGCSGDSGASSGSNGAGSASGGGGSGAGSGGNGIGFDDDAGVDDASLNEDNACRATSVQATYRERPLDLIFIVDNSGSMEEEIVSVQNNINANFASIIEQSGVDYRVIMLSEYGSAAENESICIRPPLGADNCETFGDAPTNNEPKFFHYNLRVDSHDALCLLLDSLRGGVPDRNALYPGGWIEWLRPDALKVFTIITDDNAECTTTTLAKNVTLDDHGDAESAAEGLVVADTFDAALLATAPEQFGTAAERNYMFFGFIGVREMRDMNDMPLTDPWPPTEPVLEGFRGQCDTAVGPGTGYQTLAVRTGGFRYPVCRYESYDNTFRAIANSVISGAKLECEFQVPEPPTGQSIDLKTVLVEFTPSNGGSKQTFTQVASLAECMTSAFYIEGTSIKLCPETCTFVRADNAAQMNLLYGCDVQPL